MTGRKTLAEEMQQFNDAMKELGRVCAEEVTPTMQRLTDQFTAIAQDLYRARLRRWLPVLAVAFTLSVLVGWWLS